MRPPSRPWFDRQDDRPLWLTALLVMAVLFLAFQMGGALVEFGRHASAALRFPYPLAYGEGPLLDQVTRLARGENLYPPDLSGPAWILTNHMPLYLLLQAPFVGAVGPAFWVGRALSLLSALAAALLVGLTLHTLSGDWLASAAGGLTLLAMPYILRGSALDQVELLALAMSWAGVFCVVRWPDRRLMPALAGLLFSLAVFTHPGYFLAGPLAALAWLLQTRRTRPALLLGGVLAGLCLAGWLALNTITGGGLAFHVITANAAPFSFQYVTDALVRFLPRVYFLLFAALIYLVAERFGDQTRTWPLALPYAAGALVASTAASGRMGAEVSALYEACAALALAGGAFLSWAGRSGWLKVALVVLLAVQIGDLAGWSRGEFTPQVTGRVANQAEIARVAEMVREADGPVLADEYLGLLPVSGKPVVFQPVEFNRLLQAGLWEDGPLAERIRRQEFSLILFYIPRDGGRILSQRWSQPVRDAVYEGYTLRERTAFIYIYVPK